MQPMILVGSASERCTPALVSELMRGYYKANLPSCHRSTMWVWERVLKILQSRFRTEQYRLELLLGDDLFHRTSSLHAVLFPERIVRDRELSCFGCILANTYLISITVIQSTSIYELTNRYWTS